MNMQKWALLGGWFGLAFVSIFIFLIVSDGLFPWANVQSTRDLFTMVGNEPTVRRLYMGVHFLGAFLGFVGMVWATAMYRLVSEERPTASLYFGRLFATIAFGFLTAMLIVQGSVKCGIAMRMVGKSAAEQDALFAIYGPLRIIDFGLDLTWDVFIMVAMVLLGWAMVHSRYFGRILGWSGVVIGLVLLASNLWQAPIPPEPDLKPLAFVWIIALSIQMLRVARRLARTTAAQAAGA